VSAVLGPDVIVVQDDEWFNAAVLAVGSMGVIYSLVILVRTQFGLSQFTRTGGWSAVKPMLLDGSIFTAQLDPFLLKTAPPAAPPSYLEVVINPSDADPLCWITTRTVVPLPLAPSPPTPTSLYVDAALGGSALATLVGSFLGAVAADPHLVQLLPTLIPVTAGFAIGAGNLGQLLTNVVNFATTRGAPGIVSVLEDLLIGSSRKSVSIQDKGYKIMDGYDGDDSFTAYRSMSMEVAFDGSKTGYIDYIDECIAIVKTAMDVGGVPFGGYLSTRFCASSEAFLAFERYPLNCIIEIACFKGLIGNLEIINRMEEAMYRHKGVPHWGQYHRLTNSDGYVTAHYPKLKQWRKVQQEMSMGLRTFENAFTWRCGLST
jgi:D-arabinono-1,4-lactone oxidase